MTDITLPAKYDELNQIQRRQVRERYIIRQGGRCIHCNNRLDSEPADFVKKLRLDLDLFPKGFLKHPVHLHHCRKTGLTLGAVHAKCNGVLWQYHGE